MSQRETIRGASVQVSHRDTNLIDTNVNANSMPAIRSLFFFIKGIDKEELTIGDVIVYSNERGFTIHRIVKLNENSLITKGDANNAPDQKEIPKKEIIGKVLVSVPFVGYAVDFAKKP